MLEQFSRWLRRYQGIEANPVYRLAVDVATGKTSYDRAVASAQSHHVNGRLADGDLLELDRQVEFEAGTSLEFALTLARLNAAVASAKGFDKVLVDLYLRVADLLERDEDSAEREYYFREALLTAQKISYVSGLRRSLNRLARHAFERGEVEMARDLLKQQLDVGREETDSRDEIETAILLGDIALSDGDVANAHDLFNRASRSARRIGYFSGAIDAILRQVSILRERGDLQGSLLLLQQATEAADRTVDGALQAEVAYRTGVLYRDLDMPDEAVERLRAALMLARSIGDLSMESRCLDMLSSLEQGLGQTDDAIRHYTEVIALETRLGNRHEVARAQFAMGELHVQHERYDDAVRAFMGARDIAVQVGDDDLAIRASGLLGQSQLTLGRDREAVESLMFAVEGSHAIGDRREEAHWLVTAGEVVLRLGESDNATRFATRAEELARGTGDNVLLSEVYSLIGQVALVERRLQDAEDAFGSAVAAARAAGRTGDALRFLPLLARIAAESGTLEDAIRYLDTAIDEAVTLRDGSLISQFEMQAARMLAGAGMHSEAETRYEHAIAAAERAGDQRLLARSLQGLAAMFDTAGDLDAATSYYTRALDAAVRAGDRRTVATTHYNLGALLVDEERDDEAREHLIRARDEAESLHDYGLADRARALINVLAPPMAYSDGGSGADMPLSESPARPRIYPGLE